MVILSAEDDILATLRAAALKLEEASGRKLKTIDSLPGDWDDQMLRRFHAQAPGLLIAFAGGQAQDKGSSVLDSRWLVYVITAHASGQAARRRGDAAQIGAYELLELLVVPALHEHPVPGVGTLMLDLIDNLWTGEVEKQGLAVYVVSFRLAMDFEPVPAEGDLSPFETLYAQWDVPPHDSQAEHLRWLVKDYDATKPDAEDQVKPAQT